MRSYERLEIGAGSVIVQLSNRNKESPSSPPPTVVGLRNNFMDLRTSASLLAETNGLFTKQLGMAFFMFVCCSVGKKGMSGHC
jgi:hypothetical protein